MDDIMSLAVPPPTNSTGNGNGGTTLLPQPGWSWILSTKQKKQFHKEFNKIKVEGFVTGMQAKNVFPSYGVDFGDLATIWSLSDRDLDNQLNLEEFCIARFLIEARKASVDFPSSLPESLLSSVYEGEKDTKQKEKNQEPKGVKLDKPSRSKEKIKLEESPAKSDADAKKKTAERQKSRV